MDGWVTVGTKLDTKDLEKDIKSAESKLRQYEKQAEKLTQQKAKIDLDLSAYEKEKQEIQKATDLTLQQAQTEEQVNFVLEAENLELEQLNQKYSQTFQKNEDINKAIQENTNQQNLLNNEIQEMNNKLNQSKGLDNIKNSINQASNSMTGVIKKVAKWGLAIFSIRSAYMMVRSAVSTLSQYNDQFASDIEYIRYALANTLQPVIQGIINLVKTLLVYIGYIAKAWFGVDLWASSSAKNFKKVKDGISGSSKNAKELNKQLAGFDEMNVLQESGDTKQGGGGGGTALPSFDLAAPEDVPIPSWVQWIADNKDLIIGALAGITAGLVSLKLLGLDPIMSLGIGVTIFGIISLIQDIIDFLNDPTWQNFVAILGDILIIIGGIMLIVNGNPLGILIAAIGLVAKLVAENWDKISELLSKVGTWIYEHIIKPVVDFFVGLWNTITTGVSTAWNFVVSLVSGIANWIYEHIIAPIGNFFKGLWEGIKNTFSSVVTFFKDIFTKAWNAIKNVFSSVGSFFGNIFNTIKTKLSAFGAKVGDTIGGAFKGAVNGVLKAIESILNTPIKAINGLIKVINKVPGINLKKLSTFSLPRLAKGGIISQPGRGVPVGYGQAIGGERGREGVIPLTDAQQMAMLGEAIGKYININLTNVTKLDNRVISREQKRINTQNDFAFNR